MSKSLAGTVPGRSREARWQRFRDLASAIEPLFRAARSLSFGQFGEDVLLSVCVFPRKKGFYVDVGAYHPWRNSNTYKLYLRGWSGLTVEPNPAQQDLFRRYRPRDIHVAEGIAETEGKLTYRCFQDAKLNTFSDEQAAAYQKRGSALLGEIAVKCRPLQRIIDDYAPDTPIDLMSIDCEGFDFTVLRSIDFARSRPTVIIVEDFEAFESFKTGAARSKIETYLRSLGYAPVAQAMYSTLYVDVAATRANDTATFDFSAVKTPMCDLGR